MDQIVKSFLYEPETAVGAIELTLKNLEVKGHACHCNCSEAVTGGIPMAHFPANVPESGRFQITEMICFKE